MNAGKPTTNRAARSGRKGFRPWLIQSLFSYTQTANDFPVTVGVLASQIIKQSSPLTHQFQQTSSGMVVLCVRLEMILEAFNPARKQGNLDFRRTGVGCVRLVLTDYLNLSFLS